MQVIFLYHESRFTNVLLCTKRCLWYVLGFFDRITRFRTYAQEYIDRRPWFEVEVLKLVGKYYFIDFFNFYIIRSTCYDTTYVTRVLLTIFGAAIVYIIGVCHCILNKCYLINFNYYSLLSKWFLHVQLYYLCLERILHLLKNCILT